MNKIIKVNQPFSKEIEKINFPKDKPYLWRLSSAGNHLKDENQHHFLLRENEEHISLFELKSDYILRHISTLNNEGAVFLYFMFSDVFSYLPKKGTAKKSVRLKLRNLLVLANSHQDFLYCLEYIKISLKQNHKNAQHWEMKYDPIERCNDLDIQLILQKATEHIPDFDFQDQHFIKNILDYIESQRIDER